MLHITKGIGVRTSLSISKTIVPLRSVSHNRGFDQIPNQNDDLSKKTNDSETKKNKKSPRHETIFDQFGTPFLKVCAISIGTYYALLKLRDYLDE